MASSIDLFDGSRIWCGSSVLHTEEHMRPLMSLSSPFITTDVRASGG